LPRRSPARREWDHRLDAFFGKARRFRGEPVGDHPSRGMVVRMASMLPVPADPHRAPQSLSASRWKSSRRKERANSRSGWPPARGKTRLGSSPTPGGKVRRRDFVVRSLRRLLEDAGLPAEVRIHDLRHRAATLAVRQGMPIHVVSRMFGHSDPAMTLRRYAHVFDDMREDAARSMEDLFCPPPVSQPTPTSANLARHDGFLEGVNCRCFSARSNTSRLPERLRPP
jgi:Phage integrase family